MDVNSAKDFLRHSGYEVVDPDIFEKHEEALAAARLDGERTGVVKGYLKALDDVEAKLRVKYRKLFYLPSLIICMRSDYLKEVGK